MQSNDIFRAIQRHALMPVLAIDQIEHAIPLADALIAGDLPVMEVTFRTQAAGEVLQIISRQRNQVLLGAGTVLTIENLETAKECGAQFALAPGFNPKVVQRAQELELPFIPGVATPSEIEQASSLGCRILKFFPAELMGGIAMLRALAGPFQHLGVKFVPTGGIGPDLLQSYLSLDIVAAVGGSWLAKPQDLAEGRWDAIKERSLEAVNQIAEIRTISRQTSTGSKR
ncbi:bifunctional 4-hydroxy-2-oxoglutarate aldolase/2-dehydro-3-deoxy-phosphogluconate aldolase [Bythopirellula polymerisocia]|uniref:Putative KHG/KDPG aldolase n=1 Tax=Bythopirellula polymerisocia TaxID=2528003 RepID=A0A5C6CBB6_9BACT|nr:bifunctional 4-hydroxy-2-oxoglutarate aldolase/2-dehydro-3-deoxy-phosphogluconate aldolase [Bythopirellula polymerisocia]TWU21382.1 putative KHG/KDPG aldolase [Bythopirellula polymerisocia]